MMTQANGSRGGQRLYSEGVMFNAMLAPLSLGVAKKYEGKMDVFYNIYDHDPLVNHTAGDSLLVNSLSHAQTRWKRGNQCMVSSGINDVYQRVREELKKQFGATDFDFKDGKWINPKKEHELMHKAKRFLYEQCHFVGFARGEVKYPVEDKDKFREGQVAVNCGGNVTIKADEPIATGDYVVIDFESDLLFESEEKFKQIINSKRHSLKVKSFTKSAKEAIHAALACKEAGIGEAEIRKTFSTGAAQVIGQCKSGCLLSNEMIDVKLDVKINKRSYDLLAMLDEVAKESIGDLKKKLPPPPPAGGRSGGSLPFAIPSGLPAAASSSPAAPASGGPGLFPSPDDSGSPADASGAAPSTDAPSPAPGGPPRPSRVRIEIEEVEEIVEDEETQERALALYMPTTVPEEPLVNNFEKWLNDQAEKINKENLGLSVDDKTAVGMSMLLMTPVRYISTFYKNNPTDEQLLDIGWLDYQIDIHFVMLQHSFRTLEAANKSVLSATKLKDSLRALDDDLREQLKDILYCKDREYKEAITLPNLYKLGLTEFAIEQLVPPNKPPPRPDDQVIIELSEQHGWDIFNSNEQRYEVANLMGRNATFKTLAKRSPLFDPKAFDEQFLSPFWLNEEWWYAHSIPYYLKSALYDRYLKRFSQVCSDNFDARDVEGASVYLLQSRAPKAPASVSASAEAPPPPSRSAAAAAKASSKRSSKKAKPA